VLNNPLRLIDPSGLSGQDPKDSLISTPTPPPNPCTSGPGCLPWVGEWKVTTAASGTETVGTTPAVLGTSIALRPLLAVPTIAAGVSAGTVVAGAAGIAVGVIIGGGLVDAIDNPRQPATLGPGGVGISTTTGAQAATGTTAIPIPDTLTDDPSRLNPDLVIVRGEAEHQIFRRRARYFQALSGPQSQTRRHLFLMGKSALQRLDKL
jgi:hypothetical protein